MQKLLILFLLFVLNTNSWASKFAPPSERDIEYTQKTFKVRGHWISPKIIKEFLPWMSDYNLPLIAAVDVASATDTNRYFAKIDESEQRASVKEDDGSTVSYEWKGRLANGMHALVVSEFGGGSMVANSLVVFRFSKHQATDANGKKYPQLLLEIERVVSLGDRAQSKIALKDNEIDVNVECKKTCDSKHLKIMLQ